MQKKYLSFLQSPFRTNRIFLCVFVALLGLASISFSAYSANNSQNLENNPAGDISPESKQVKTSCCGAAQPDNVVQTYTLVGSYYSLKDGQETTLMFNNKGPEPLVVSPTFFSLSGDRLDLPAFVIPATAYEEVDLRVLLGNYMPQFEEGSLQVTHQGMRLQLGAQFKILKQGMLFDEQFITPATRFPSSRMESVWWLPSPQCETKFIVSNTTDAPVTATIEVDGTAPRQRQPATIQLNPHQTRVLDILRDLIGQDNGGTLHKTGGISITHSGTPGAILARMLVSKESTGYSSVVNFTDPTVPRSSKLNGGGLRLGSIGSDELTPIVVARNVGSEPTTVRGRVPYTNESGDVVFITIPEVNIAAGKIKQIDVERALREANVPPGVAFAGIELEYTTAPGSVIMTAQSVSRSGQQVFQVPLLDPNRMPSSAGGFPWKVDSDYTTVIFIKNETDTPKKYLARLVYEGGGYALKPREIKAGQTVALDFKQMRDEQTPDSKGNLIPLSAERGQVSWSMVGADNNTMSGRSEQVNMTLGISSTYACYNCCPDSLTDGIPTPIFYQLNVGYDLLYGFTANVSNCYGFQGPTLFDGFNWFSSNLLVGEIDYYGLATAMDGGTAYMTGQFEEVVWTNRPNGLCDMQSNIISGSGEMNVPPRVLDVSANGATRITQVVGDTNIFHFVTPKGAANSQVTLTAAIQYSDIHVPNDIDWEGATESPNNPFQATLSKDTASKNIVKIKYRGNVIKELRVWVVWTTITSTDIALSPISNAVVGSPPGAALALQGGYNFTHTINPSEIITDSNRPNFSGTNVNSPPGGNHPIYGTTLSGGANKKWDNSRQIRFKVLNPDNINVNDTAFAVYGQVSDVLNFPLNDVEGNDDSTTNDERNDPYTQQDRGVLIGQDITKFGLAHRGGVNGNTYELRFQFREFTRLEIEGTWYRISDFYPWRVHYKFLKSGSVWVDDSSDKALDNSGF